MLGEVRQLMMAHGFLYAITVVRGGGVTELGEKAALKYPYIANDFLRLSPQEFFEWLEGQILPMSWRQGRVEAFVHKPKSDLIVVLFSHFGGDDQLSVDDLQARCELVEQVDRELALLMGAN